MELYPIEEAQRRDPTASSRIATANETNRTGWKHRAG